MRHLTKILVFLFLFFSCSSKKMRRYINHEKWQVSAINGGIVLKGKPTEVKTIFYPELIDTNLLATGETFFNYELHHFDGEGNLVYSKFFLDSSSWGEHF